jgi:hypothetical protein
LSRLPLLQDSKCQPLSSSSSVDTATNRSGPCTTRRRWRVCGARHRRCNGWYMGITNTRLEGWPNIPGLDPLGTTNSAVSAEPPSSWHKLTMMRPYGAIDGDCPTALLQISDGTVKFRPSISVWRCQIQIHHFPPFELIHHVTSMDAE